MISFIYEWLDTRTNLKYIGRHIGHLDDGYVGSGTIFKSEYSCRPEDFIRTIIWQEEYTTDDIVKLKEDEILSKIPNDELYNGINRKYYNQVKNSWGYTSVDNPMKNPDVVARMVATQKKNGNKGPHHNTIQKYGVDEWSKINSEKKIGNTFGSGNKDKAKTEEHKRKISESRKHQTNHNGGRKRITPYNELISIVKEKGFKNAAAHLDISVAALKGRYYNAVKALNK